VTGSLVKYVITLKLVNRVYRYAVTIINTIINIFLTDTDPFIYNITSYYTSIKFIGAITDTKAPKRSIVGYS
jgi:hypothetical protein